MQTNFVWCAWLAFLHSDLARVMATHLLKGVGLDRVQDVTACFKLLELQLAELVETICKHWFTTDHRIALQLQLHNQALPAASSKLDHGQTHHLCKPARRLVAAAASPTSDS